MSNNNKKSFTLVLASLAFVLLLVFMVIFLLLQPFLLRDYSKAKTAEIVFFTNTENEQTSEIIVSLSSEDTKELISYLEGGGVRSGGVCTPDSIAIRLSNGWQSVLLYPAGDGCPGLEFTTNVVNKTVIISKDDMDKLIDFIQVRMPLKEQMPSFESYDYYKFNWTAQ